MTLWSTINKAVDNVKNQATYAVMDAIIQSSSLQAVYSTVMLATSAAQVVRNEKMSAAAGSVGNSAKALGLTVTSDIISGLGGTIGLIDISLVTNAATAAVLSKASPYLQEVWEKTLVLPNIEGIPINTSSLATSREVEVGEQMMIVQSTLQKQYWTDNAVPKLKEWQLEGYITTALSLDSLYLIRPSLKMQLNFLDTCAASRRPVLFKDNRGEFMFVQITNLQTTEEATYNNAIKVNISLKEYKPFTVDYGQAKYEIASRVN
jgi:hypothetical protein